VYAPEKLRFDHHQPTFQGVFSDQFSTKLPSAGLIYKHFGKDLIQTIMHTDEHQTAVLYKQIYKSFIEHIDGIDNGIEASGDPSTKKNYSITTHLSSRVQRLNPRWNQPNNETIENDAFKEAVALTGNEFIDTVRYLGEGWLPARKIVEDAVSARESVDSSGAIIKLSMFSPWQEHLFNIEAERGLAAVIKYAIFQDVKGSWRVQAVPEGEGGFKNRLALPAAWRGLRDKDLDEKAGISGCIFVHASGFIGGHATEQGALEMAKKALLL